MCKLTTSRNRSPRKAKQDHVSSFSRVLNLNWTSRPTRYLPHGLLGAISLIIGLHLTVCSFLGELGPFQHSEGAWLFPSYAFMIYFWSMFLSGVAGFQMAPFAQPNTRFLFRFLGLELCFLSYFALRPVPTFAMSVGHTIIVRVLDVTLSISMVLLVVYGLRSITSLVGQGKVPLAQGIASYPAFASLATLIFLPLHFAYYGQVWYECVHEEFPKFYTVVAYAYVPATVCFSIIAFSASLYQRKIIGTPGMATALSFALLSLLATVLIMEYHVPYVAVQRLYMPCPFPADDSFQASLVRSLDASPLSRHVLSSLGIEVKVPEALFE